MHSPLLVYTAVMVTLIYLEIASAENTFRKYYKNVLKRLRVEKPVATRLVFIINGQKRTDMINVQDDKALIIAIEADDKFGNPVQVADVPSFALSDPSYGDLIANADGTTSFISNGKLGTVQLQAMVGALVGNLDMNVIAGAAVSLKINASQA